MQINTFPKSGEVFVRRRTGDSIASKPDGDCGATSRDVDSCLKAEELRDKLFEAYLQK